MPGSRSGDICLEEMMIPLHPGPRRARSSLRITGTPASTPTIMRRPRLPKRPRRGRGVARTRLRVTAAKKTKTSASYKISSECLEYLIQDPVTTVCNHMCYVRLRSPPPLPRKAELPTPFAWKTWKTSTKVTLRTCRTRTTPTRATNVKRGPRISARTVGARNVGERVRAVS